jgi:excisionase family DNA binding protein
MTTWATKKEAAEHTRRSEKLIAQAVADGDLKAYKVGKGNRDYVLDLDEVDAWVRSNSYEPRRSA